MGHYYKHDGAPCHKVPYADPEKGLRDTTIRDAKKLNLLPSVTEILNILAKPGLDIWKQQQMMLAALTLPRIEGESDDELIKRIKADAKESAQKAADIGTAIHAALAAEWNRKGIYGNDWIWLALEVIEYIEEFTGIKEGWIAEESFASVDLGYGGTCDLYHPEEQIVIDYKTTETHLDKDGKLKNLVYPEQRLQLAAYADGLFNKVDGITAYNVYADYAGDICRHKYQLNHDDANHFWFIKRCWNFGKKYFPMPEAA